MVSLNEDTKMEKVQLCFSKHGWRESS